MNINISITTSLPKMKKQDPVHVSRVGDFARILNLRYTDPE
jgi:hypothetical protein